MKMKGQRLWLLCSRSSMSFTKMPQIRRYSELAITDPLVLYESRISRGILNKDEAQHRAAIEFQKLYYRTIDYTLPTSFRKQIRDLNDMFEKEDTELRKQQEEKPSEHIWYVPSKESQELIKVLSDEEELYNFHSPQGLLLHGEVGCGKSMLMDMFAECLPHVSKKRWHYNNFMLNVYGQIHRIQIQQKNNAQYARKKAGHELILLQIAENMIDESTILLLDEFMLPDMAAAKIVKTLFIYYFKLGGVLVATSNRLPKDLYANEFQRAQFTQFFDILQHRCVTHDMRSTNDYRSILSHGGGRLAYYLPKEADLRDLLQGSDTAGSASPSQIEVYGHKVDIPWQTEDGIAMFDFEDICGKPLAAADYISLAARYDTFLIDNVPVLTLRKKNEARRFITLLDALYESRCRIAIRASTHIETLFFPDVLKGKDDVEDELPDSDQETFGKAVQDLEAPYRPNVSLYNTEDVSVKIKPDGPMASYSNVSAFTGEDEKFAYKRAVSRLTEMTSSQWWETTEWMPVADRPWEMETATEREHSQKNLALKRKVPRPMAPQFQPQHFWAMGQWNPRPNSKVINERTKKWMQGVTA